MRSPAGPCIYIQKGVHNIILINCIYTYVCIVDIRKFSLWTKFHYTRTVCEKGNEEISSRHCADEACVSFYPCFRPFPFTSNDLLTERRPRRGNVYIKLCDGRRVISEGDTVRIDRYDIIIVWEIRLKKKIQKIYYFFQRVSCNIKPKFGPCVRSWKS